MLLGRKSLVSWQVGVRAVCSRAGIAFGEVYFASFLHSDGLLGGLCDQKCRYLGKEL